jgi:hypothetical protein
VTALALAAVSAAAWLQAAAADLAARDAAAAPVVARQAALSAPSLLAPPTPRGVTRASLEVRPFLGLISNSFGGIAEARVEHEFRAPFMLGLELAPLAVAADGEGPGAIAHARVHGAFSTDYLAVGLGLGARLQHFGRSGLSVAPTLRLGSLDGLALLVEYSYSLAPNRFTGQRTVGFDDALGKLRVPLAARLALELDGGLGLGSWAFATLGLRHRLAGDGGPGTWFVSGALGGAWVYDSAPCNFDAVVPCGRSARSFGPTIGFGLERRF